MTTFATDEIEISISGETSPLTVRESAGTIHSATITRLEGGSRSMSDVAAMLMGREVPGVGLVHRVEMFCTGQHVGSLIGLYVKDQ